MGNTFTNQLNPTNEDVLVVDEIRGCVDNVAEYAMNISSDTSQIVGMIPKDGYNKKLEIISEAHDMSTDEKLAAISEADEKYVQNVSDAAEIYEGIMRTKVILTVFSIASIVMLLSSSDSRKTAEKIVKLFTKKVLNGNEKS